MKLEDLLAAERRREARRLAQAALFAALVAAASVVLLGLSGWFITAASVAGAAGTAVAQTFNYMLPSAGIRLLAIVRTGARYGERLASHNAALGALARLRPALFRAIAASPVASALALGRGDATARLIGDVDAIELRFVRRSGPWGAAAALASGVALTWLGGIAAVAATVSCVVLLLVVADRLWRGQEAQGRAVQQAQGALRETFATLSDAAPELRCYGLEAWAAERIAAAGDALAAAQRAQAKLSAQFELLHAGTVGVAAALALLLSIGAGAPIAALAALAAAMTVDGAAPVMRAMIERGRLREAEERLGTLFDAAETEVAGVQEPLQPATITIGAPIGCRLEPGERLALVGPSGVGKTTLVETLLGLRHTAPGTATIGGVDVAAMDVTAQRRQFAWTPQDAMLISGTVRDNLKLAAPDSDDSALWAALHDAALDARIWALPGGLDAWIGENGERLSGGERRRLALARAYCADAPWLLLDEPSEGVDAETEALLATRLDMRLRRTQQGLLLVSHRPGMVALCRRRLVLNGDALPACLSLVA
ncbi:ATP-binding cassette subfamily C protein CydC [Sphingomonas zeicaulis]|uniref:amino acid ABC transporter ATP-binding/permease protein n=1 Tax=Sphingomonas zeicaulis TaxID=1632740 RepID=UPI003D1BCA44